MMPFRLFGLILELRSFGISGYGEIDAWTSTSRVPMRLELKGGTLRSEDAASPRNIGQCFRL